jgi:hypothetical protein
MAITALSGIAPEWYTPEQDGEEGDKTKFHLQPLTSMQHAEMFATCCIEDGMVHLSDKSVQVCLKYGLIGWENFKDESGELIEFSRILISKVPGDTLFELAGRIFKTSMLGDTDKKKSQ